jgi:uncharacterized membrane protein
MLNLPKHPVFRGHPLHAMLSDLPIGLLPAAAAATLAAGKRSRRNRGAHRVADVLTTMTFASAATAAGAGIWDWLTMPRSHPAWLPATIHGALNATGVVALGAAMVIPRHRLALLGAVGGGTLVAAWLGGDLVFAHGWRVKPAEEYEIVAERVTSGADGAVIGEARDEVEKFEHEKTFLAR